MNIKELLDKRVLILDGGMATAIQAHEFAKKTYRGMQVPVRINCEEFNQTAPWLIEQIHEEYIEAGADIITTNTFSANRISQQAFRCAHLVRQFNLAGARCARRVADKCRKRRIWVAGSVGPTSFSLNRAHGIDYDHLVGVFVEQVEALVDGGVDLLLLETCFNPHNTQAALNAIWQVIYCRGMVAIPVMVSIAVNRQGTCMASGVRLAEFVDSVIRHPILSLGVNCVYDLSALRTALECIATRWMGYVSVHPSAGLPNENGLYPILPQAMALNMKTLMHDCRLHIVGGCCGTTPEHIKAVVHEFKG